MIDYFDLKFPYDKKKIAAPQLAYHIIALDKFSGTDPDQDAVAFIQLRERKNKFALGNAPTNTDALAIYTFRKNALFSSSHRGPATECYESNVEAATIWRGMNTGFNLKISDRRNKFCQRMEKEHCIRKYDEEIPNFRHQIKRTLDKGWPEDTKGVAGPQQTAEQATQARQRRQRYMDYGHRGLRPK